MEKIEIRSEKEQTVFDLILSARPNLNFNFLKTVLRKKDIRVNGKKIDDNCIIYPNDIVVAYFPGREKKQVEIAYQDKNILVAIKPQGMEVTKQDKAFDQSECLEEIFSPFLACHRLDKNTAGLVVMAKNKKICDLMCDAIKQHKLKKYYQAIVYGKVEKQQNFVDYIEKKDGYVVVHRTEKNGTKIAKTNYCLIKNFGELSLLNIEILTGRTHQIRAQLASHNIFVLGDERYGKKEINKKYHLKKQQLFAYKIEFNDMPNDLKYLNKKIIETKPPFEEFLKKNEQN